MEESNEDGEVHVHPIVNYGGYWAEIKLTAQIASSLYARGGAGVQSCVKLAQEIIDASKKHVDEIFDKREATSRQENSDEEAS